MNTLEHAITLIHDSPYREILEFGVYNGRTITTIRNNVDSSFRISGFDTFDGLPEEWTGEHGVALEKGSFSTGGNIPNVPNVSFFKGLFKDTIPEYKKDAKDLALLHVDCDLYSSTKDVLWSLNDFIRPQTIIVFDEWLYYTKDGYQYNADHEQKCFYEWCDAFKRKTEFIEFSGTCPNDFERKIVRIIK